MLAITSGPTRGTQFADEAVHDFDDAQAANQSATAQTAAHASQDGQGTSALTGLVPAGGLHPVAEDAVAKGKSKADTIREFRLEMMLVMACLARDAQARHPSGLRG